MRKLKEPPAPFDVQAWKRLSHVDRIRPMADRWVDHGADSPPAIHLFYLVKIFVYVVGGLLVISATSGFGGLSQLGSWWSEPLVYQKAMFWTMLLEVLGFAGASGPLMFKFLPPFTAFLHWFRPGTIRQPPWPRYVPLTKGDRRTVVDVALFTGVVSCLVALLLSPGVGAPPPGATAGLLPTPLLVALIVLHGLLGLRDKAVFLSARAEMYWVGAIICLFPYDDMMIGLKLALICIWIGAGISKINHIFPYVVAVMISNAPLRPKWLKRACYRNAPKDLRPSRLAFLLAHVGTLVEALVPVALLLFVHSGPAALIGALVLVVFHLHIISTIPMGVPNEWNGFMIFGALYWFWAHADVSLSQLHNPLLVVVLLVFLIGPVVLGNLRPDLVSFLPSMRYYAGNWAIGLWCFRGDADRKLGQHITKASGTYGEQLERLFSSDFAELASFRLGASRSMHPQGRALNALLLRAVDDVDAYVVHDGEPLTGALMGWNFGDGHMHNEQLLAAVQRRCDYAEGELVLVFLESQPIHRQRQEYRIVDAATGVIERGYIAMKDVLALPAAADASAPIHVSWSRTDTSNKGVAS